MKNIRNQTQYLHEYGDRTAYSDYRTKVLENAKYPPVVFKADGTPSTDFKWKRKVGHISTFTDFPTDCPVKRNQRNDVWICNDLGLEITLEITDYPEFPIAEYLPRIKNIGSSASPVITELKTIDFEFFAGADEFYVHHNNGGHNGSNEYEYFCDKLKFGSDKCALTVQNVEGFPTDFALPCFNMENKEDGRGIIAVLSWAANWKADFSVSECSCRLSASQGYTEFSLFPDEQVRAPLAVLLFYKGEWLHGMNLWRMFCYKHNVLRDHGKRMTTNMLYCISTGDNGMLNTEAENLAAVQETVDSGINGMVDFINQDAGWAYSGDHPDWNFLGNWRPDERRYPSGLKTVADAAHKNGMLYSLWLEPERIMKNTDLYFALGKNAICTERDENGDFKVRDNDTTSDDSVFWANFCDPKTVDYITDMVDGIIKEQHVDQYRQDNGFWNIADIWRALDRRSTEESGIPRYGLSEEAFVVGFHRYWKALMDRNPGLLIDSCCAGGRRNDLETVRMSFIHTRSDCYEDKDNSQTQTYGMAMWYMLMGTAMLDYCDKYDMHSRLCSSYAVIPPSPEKKAAFLKAVDNWKNYMSMFFSIYYPLTPAKYDHESIVAMQFEDIDNGRGMIPIYIRKSGSITVYPKGLCTDCLYDVWEEDGEVLTYTGKKLTEEGISVSSDTRRSFMYLYERK